ncbi:siphovirus ReqiPepy6 Gp37-like family protein [Bacillus sp. FJAT-49736]|uniref:siphovirus ReqiPepy6 Gp37-like family protein n=1 Tax=Bacillus sp. FJAT-49736 TaxID=2833582 RepID=UPI001BC97BFE|nr:siphovirus ReqiPepy6 Gp37-like family protein [Bacillus sp. FJAT-49736]MBS4171947.1 siphovirus ReqiPepy6 Gp37-like family protein [Bacillus sp. FJAT-49736]
MNIFVFNNKFEMQGIVDTFGSLIWHREYYKTGTFELHLDVPKENKDALSLIFLLRKGNVLAKENSMEEAGYIEDIKLDDENAEKLVVTGYFIQNIISHKIVWRQQSSTGTVEEVMKYFIDKNCINPVDPNRITPHLVLSNNRGISKLANEISTNDNLGELIENLAVKYDVGWRVIFDLLNKEYIFDIFEGIDRSINQSVNPQAVFSLEFENVIKQTYTDSDNNLKNVALIWGENQKEVVVNNNISGFERREIFVDSQSLSKTIKNDDGTEKTLTDTEYQELLVEQGNSKLAETQRILTFEADVSVTSNLKYKEDFDLGDIVTIKNERWGVLLNTRITTVEEVYENDTLDIRVNFGSNIPTLIDKIKQRTR